jgi:hypothetical protein
MRPLHTAYQCSSLLLQLNEQIKIAQQTAAATAPCGIVQRASDECAKIYHSLVIIIGAKLFGRQAGSLCDHNVSAPSLVRARGGR